MNTNQQAITGAIGEYLVLAELLKRDFKAFLAHGANNVGWDILIEKNKKCLKVQVKTICKENSKSLNFSNVSMFNFDYTVIVILDRPEEVDDQSVDKYIILSREFIEEKLSKINTDRKDKKRTFYLNKDLEEKYANQWSIIK